MNSAKEELLLFAKQYSYINKNTLNSILKPYYLLWKNPCQDWTASDVEKVKKNISETIRNLPYEDRYDVYEIINEFMSTHFGNLGFSEIRWEDCHESVDFDIEILKLTQGGTNPEINCGSREALAEKLHISTDGLKPYLKSLQEGKDLLGSEVKIELKRGKNIYDSTIHPVFLALNLTEVNFLVNYLRCDYAGTEFETVAEQISYDIYRQLSEYGRERMDAVAKNNNLDLTKSKNGKELRKGYHKELDMQGIPCLMKCGKCVMIKKETDSKVATGYVTSEQRCYYFIDDDGKKTKLDENTLCEYLVKPFHP